MTLTGITIWRPKDVTKLNLPVLRRASPDFISVKAVDATRKFQPKDTVELIRKLVDAGVRGVHLWGWHELLSQQDAEVEAELAAESLLYFGVRNYHVNAEKRWLKQGTKQARNNFRVFVNRLRSMAPGCTIWGNTFSKGMDAELAESIDVWEPMCYGTRRRTMKMQIERRAGKFRKKLPSLRVCPMIGTGRTDSKGNVWGWWEGKDGWLELILEHQPHAVNWFRWPLNSVGNKHNPSVGEQIAQLVMEQEKLRGSC